MSEKSATTLANEVTGPLAGQISVFAGNTTMSSQDLGLCGGVTANMSNADVQPTTVPLNVGGSLGPVNVNGCIDHYVEFFADGVDFGCVWGPNVAMVTGNNAPNLSQTGADTTNSNGSCCLRIPTGTFRSFYIHSTTRFLGFTAASNTGFLRISLTSRSR